MTVRATPEKARSLKLEPETVRRGRPRIAVSAERATDVVVTSPLLPPKAGAISSFEPGRRAVAGRLEAVRSLVQRVRQALAPRIAALRAQLTNILHHWLSAKNRDFALSSVSPLEENELRLLRMGHVSPRHVARVQHAALMDLFRLSTRPQERKFQELAQAELARFQGQPAVNVALAGREPPLAELHARKAASVEGLLRLQLLGKLSLDPELLRALVEQGGSYGEAHTADAIRALQATPAVAGDPALSQACTDALAGIQRAQAPKVTFVALEGGPIKAGGIRSYLNSLLRARGQQGQSSDLLLPLPGHLDPKKEKLQPVPGSEGTVELPNGKTVHFSLLKLEGEPGKDGARTTTWFIQDDTYFSVRNGVYVDEDGRNFPDESERWFAGAALTSAALSKIAAIRKLGESPRLTAKQVAAAEQTLKPQDAPDLIQYNDSHLGALLPMLQANPVFRKSAALGVMHNGEPGYEAWVPRWMFGDLLESGGRLAQVPDHNGYVNLAELMAVATDRYNGVSPGYVRRLLNDRANRSLFQTLLQAASAEGRLHDVINGIFLEDDSSVRIDGTSRAQAYQKELGFPEDPQAPFFADGNRICTQKGFRQLLGLLEQDEHGNPITPLDKLIEAYPKAQIVIGGELAERDLGLMLKAFEARHPANVRVKFGYLDNQKAMSAADVFLIPSVAEPCGLADLEAMAKGCAILRSNRDGLEDKSRPYDPLYGTGEAFVCDPSDPGSIVAALLQAAAWASRPEAQKQQLRLNAMARVKDFNALDWSANMTALIRETINQRALDDAA